MHKLAALSVLSIMVSLAPHTVRADTAAGDLSGLAEKGSFHLEKLAASGKCFKARMEYPVFGRPKLDQPIRAWARRTFAREAAGLKSECLKNLERARENPWEFGASPEVTATAGTVSIQFELWDYSGGVHGNPWTQTMVLNAQGKELGCDDLFLKPDGLWKFLSEYAKADLRSDLESYWKDDPSWITRGLAPKAESFKNFVVTPDGLTLIFSVGVLGPYPAGPQSSDVSLDDLARFSPKPGIWGPAAGAPATGAPTTPRAISPSEKASAAPASPGRVLPSFGCAKASNPVERAICANSTLAELDVKLAAAYKKALAAAADKESLKARQRQWLQRMSDQCANADDVPCIQERYAKRLAELKAN